ncbi:MAG: recombinase family protein [Bilophila sp.]
MDVGYIRVSSPDQNTLRQLEGVSVTRVFSDCVSGSTTQRSGLTACLDFIRDGDTLHVHSIDRLARNLQDLLRLLSDLIAKGISVHFHKENLLFSNEDNSFQRLHLQIIGAVAEFERELLRERQREGILQAKKLGKYKGRKCSLNPQEIVRIKERIEAREKVTHIAREYGVTRQTIYRSLRRQGLDPLPEAAKPCPIQSARMQTVTKRNGAKRTKAV